MSNQLKYGILAVVVLTTVLLVWLFGSGGEKEKTTGSGKIAYVSSNWKDQYQWQSKDPYGLFIFNDLLKEHVKDSAYVNVSDKKTLDSIVTSERPATYLFLGNEFGMYDDELDTLFKEIESGSDLIIISGKVTENFAESFEPELRFTYDYSRVAKVEYGKESSELIYLFQQDTLAYPWQMISHPGNYEPGTKIISTISGRANFIAFPYGKGRILIHSTPECFFNFQLNRKEGFRYADKVIREIDPKKELRYLELGRIKERKPEDFFEQMKDNKQGERDDSYLQFLFQTPALRAALLLALLGVLLFVIFRTRRMQPQVEVLPTKRNMSEIFVQTIASIYRNKDNPLSVLNLHKKNFYNTVHRHFFIDLSKRTDHREIDHLASRCGASREEIEQILLRLETSDSDKVNDDFLFETIKQKRDFYEKTGIISEKIMQRLEDRTIIFYRSIWLSFPLILAGIGLILGGLFLLVKSSGLGILLWPLGTITLIWGLARMSRPLLKLKSNEILVYPIFLGKKRYTLEQISGAEKYDKRITLHLKSGEKVSIDLNELSNQDLVQFNQYLIKHKIIEF